jgi:hypothetical protein
MQDMVYLYYKVHDGNICELGRDQFVSGVKGAFQLGDEQIDIMKLAVITNSEMIKPEIDATALKEMLERVQVLATKYGIPLSTIICSGSVYSIDTYRGISAARKRKDSIDKQRELMLQAVIRNTQRTVNTLIEDLNSVSVQLISEMKNSLDNIEKINKLAALLSRLTNGAEVISKQGLAADKQLYVSRATK